MQLVVPYDELFKKYYDVQNIFDVQPNATIQHFTTCFLGIVFLVLTLGFWYIILEKVWKPDWYINATNEEGYPRTYIVWYMMQMTHHVIQGYVSILNLYSLCDKSLGSIRCDKECLLTYKPYVSHSIMFSQAYFLVDLFVLLFVFKSNTKLGRQSLVHHGLCILVYIICLLGGRHLPATSQSVMLCEVSNIFLCVRDFMGKKATGLASTVNIGLFFVTFTIFRMIFFPAVLIAHFQTIWYVREGSNKQTFFQNFAWFFSGLIFSLVFLLNSYWYYFMLKRVQKMISPPIKGTDPGEIDYDDGFDMMADEPVKENNQESNIEPINE